MSTASIEGQGRPAAMQHEIDRGDPWVPLCRVDDIPRLGARRVQRVAGSPVALFRLADDRVHALLDRCPHRGGPLSQGLVFGDRVSCPLHGWTISLVDGAAAAPDVGRTAHYDVRVEAGLVHLLRSDLDAEDPAPGEACLESACGAGACR